MKLSDVIPWGRSYEEYAEMFSLNDDDLDARILGCGDGPASFNSELTQMGKNIISCDPIYAFSRVEIESRVEEAELIVSAELQKTKGQYIWNSFKSPELLCKKRLEAMRAFFEDYETGQREGRYWAAELPDLPFPDKSFDIALVSHFLFLYSKHKDLEFHKNAILELLRVAMEVRIYPLVTLDGEVSPHLQPILDFLNKQDGVVTAIRHSKYRFQRNAKQMLIVSRSKLARESYSV